MTSVSAMTPMGDADAMERDPVDDFREALLDAIPSWAADVGMLMNGRLRSLETILAVSILLPPPTARMNSDPNSMTCFSTFSTFSAVASQTMQALAVTNAATDLPVFRPLIGMDKEEIITRAREINTFETSILPYEDCCTVFTPRHPKTRPELSKVLVEERKLDFEALCAEAADTDNVIYLKADFRD